MQISAELSAELVRELLHVTLPIEVSGQQIQQMRNLDDLPVAAAQDVLRLLESRSLVLPDQFGSLS